MVNNKIKHLTKIFLRDYIEKLNIKNEKNKINKKSSTIWLGSILIFCITYISVYLISNLNKQNTPEIFLKIYLPIMAIFMLYQLIILVCNLFFYSKDIEYILPLPLKPIEILIAKLFTVIGIMYMLEGVLLLIPIFMYGILAAGTIKFFIYGIFSLAIFPILFVLIIGILTLILNKIFEKIKNKNIVQLLIVFILTIILTLIIFNILKGNIGQINNIENIEMMEQNLENIDDKFIIIKPIINLLTEKNIINNIFNIFIILFINLIIYIIFLFIGKKLYTNKILIYQLKNKIKDKTENKIKNNYKKQKKEIKYLKIEIKKILKNTTYFTQTIFNYINIIILALFMLKIFTPMFIQQVQADNYIESVGIEQVKIEATCTVLVIIQIISTFNNLAMTAVSKEGKEATFMKYIPMSLYKQTIIKLIPQIILNLIMSLLVIIIINSCIKIPITYSIIVFITSLLVNIIYSFIMIIVDIKKPNLNWTSIESITKNNSNKMYRYVITIAIVLMFMYFAKIFKNINYNISIIIINLFLIIILVILNIYVRKNIRKIFSKII